MLAFVALRIGDQTPPRQLGELSLISSLEYESSSCSSFGRNFGRWSYQRRKSVVVFSCLSWDRLRTSAVHQLDEARVLISRRSRATGNGSPNGSSWSMTDTEVAFVRHPIRSEPRLMVPGCLPARDVPAECLKTNCRRQLL
jgi:hypothetical protein